MVDTLEVVRDEVDWLDYFDLIKSLNDLVVLLLLQNLCDLLLYVRVIALDQYLVTLDQA